MRQARDVGIGPRGDGESHISLEGARWASGSLPRAILASDTTAFISTAHMSSLARTKPMAVSSRSLSWVASFGSHDIRELLLTVAPPLVCPMEDAGWPRRSLTMRLPSSVGSIRSSASSCFASRRHELRRLSTTLAEGPPSAPA